MIKSFRKKPVVIQAIQVPVKQGTQGVAHVCIWCNGIENEDGSISIATMEGIMTASPLDWVIKGVNGEFYPCKPDIFEKTYEPVD